MRFYSTVSKWRQDILKKRLLEKDVISASQFNLMANTLNHPKYAYSKLPAKGTILPPAWHLAYFPPRVPESELSSDGYETDWSPPYPYIHRMWAGGELSWSKDNPLKVGQNVTMQSSIRDVQMRQGGRRGDSIFIWVDKELHNEQGWSATESRCWVYVKQQDKGTCIVMMVSSKVIKHLQQMLSINNNKCANPQRAHHQPRLLILLPT